MSKNDRRTFLQLMSGGAMAASLPASIARALALPANNLTGTIQDIEHIVILMQENRSFDHYFGKLRGVRGFSDPRAVTLPTGKSVWYQPNGKYAEVTPFHPTAPDLGLQFIEDLSHDWVSTHGAWNDGHYDRWIPNKGTTTMAHLTRNDIPYHYALADAFTICDAYHCSVMGPTDPNRYYMWTGWVGNDGKGGGPVIDNAEAGYSWSTYPERLQKAGITWKIYQDVGLGLTADEYWGYTDDAYIGNYGDNALLYFHQYQNAEPGNPLADNAKVGTDILAGGSLFDQFIHDIGNGTLPQVSWIVASEAYTEHPNWPANYGAWYVSQILDALTARPEIWSKTAFLLTYDENDGFFDHMVPPTVPLSATGGISTVETTNEIYAGDAKTPAGPYGLGVRVPMVVISPWSKGGFVCSQLFDHTSIIRFIEERFGASNPALRESHISAWRRSVCGDLTSAFNFKTPNAAPALLPSTASYEPPTDSRYPGYVPVPPATQSVPVQEPGIRYARPIPYDLKVVAHANIAKQKLELDFTNAGTVGACFQVRAQHAKSGPWSYTVGAHASVSDMLAVASSSTGDYDFFVYGPNGFTRRFRGGIPASGKGRANLASAVTYDKVGNGVSLVVENHATTDVTIRIVDQYTRESFAEMLASGQVFRRYWSLGPTFGWYDLTITASNDASFLQQLAGHVETGRDSASDPAIGSAR